MLRAITPAHKWWSSQGSMDAVHKRFNRVEEYAAIIHRIHAYGIAV